MIAVSLVAELTREHKSDSSYAKVAEMNKLKLTNLKANKRFALFVANRYHQAKSTAMNVTRQLPSNANSVVQMLQHANIVHFVTVLGVVVICYTQTSSEIVQVLIATDMLRASRLKSTTEEYKERRCDIQVSKHWSNEEKLFLEEKWGTTNVVSISKKLNRSVNAIVLKAQKMGLPRFYESGDYMTLNQFFLYAVGRNVNSYDKISYIDNLGLPIKYKKNVNKCVRIITASDFWKWAEKHRDKFDFSRLPTGAFGIEPQWVAEQRKLDEKRNTLVHKNQWSKADDDTLKFMINVYRYTYSDIAKRLHRTEGAVVRRISTLELKGRPLRNPPHSVWSEEQLSMLTDLIKQGYSYEVMAETIGKSSKAIRGKVYCIYRTERLDKVRGLI